MSRASTNEVPTNGSVTQNHSGLMTKNPIHAKADIKNRSQYNFLEEFVFVEFIDFY